MIRPEQHNKWNLNGQLQIKKCAKVLPASAMKTPLISLKAAHSTSAAAENKNNQRCRRKISSIDTTATSKKKQSNKILEFCK
jgi:hypothetical protein